MKFDQLKGLLSSVVGTVSEKGKGYADVAAEKTKAAGRIAKLTVDLNGEKESLKKAYAAIGQTYMENEREKAEGLLAQLCEEAEAVAERIAAMESELAELKAGFAPAEKADVEVSFEEIVEEAEKEAECCCEGEKEGECCCAEGEECQCEGEKEGECCCAEGEECQCEGEKAEECCCAEGEKAPEADKAAEIREKVEQVAEKVGAVVDAVVEKVEGIVEDLKNGDK